MTHEWRIARAGKKCGYDGQTIPEGRPYQVVTTLGATPRIRCSGHAIGTCDLDAIAAARAVDDQVQERLAIEQSELATALPKKVVRRIPRPRTVQPFSTIADVDLFDPKMAAAGDK